MDEKFFEKKPTLKPWTQRPPVDVEALEHARNCVVDQNDKNPHRLDSRALEALDRAILEGKAAAGEVASDSR